MFQSLDHIAVVVKDTDEALAFYRDVLGFPVLFSEVLEEQSVRLTHLDLGNVHLQLVQPLREDHPLSEHLRRHGEGLHHLCLRVDSVPGAIQALPERGLRSRDAEPRRGPKGRQAAFIDPATTRGVLLEITGETELRS
jgi:methylmalonyl-CoA/ethylmalonyl-CoA epimerase